MSRAHPQPITLRLESGLIGPILVTCLPLSLRVQIHSNHMDYEFKRGTDNVFLGQSPKTIEI